jgi:hypothetical protein
MPDQVKICGFSMNDYALYRAASIFGQFDLFFSSKNFDWLKNFIEFYKKVSSDVKRRTN